MYTFSTERLLLSAPRQASVDRASRRGEQKAEEVQRKTYTLIYPDPLLRHTANPYWIGYGCV
jgi:hypothetical protein